jgi:hypothetical protein
VLLGGSGLRKTAEQTGKRDKAHGKRTRAPAPRGPFGLR